MLLRMRLLIGSVLNALGFPGLVQDVEYDAGICKAKITVKRLGLFTVISVNGLDVYFHRLTGAIDGVGFSPTSGYTQAVTPESGHFALPHEPVMEPIRMRRL